MAWVIAFASAAGVSAADAPRAASAQGDAYDAAQELFDAFAPSEVKARYRFPTRQEAQAALEQIQKAIQSGNLDDLAKYADQARDLLPVLQAIPGFEGSADWLATHLDELEAAKALRRAPATPGPRTPSPHETAGPEPEAIPYYAAWRERLRSRPLAPTANEIMPRLQQAFSAEGVPPRIAWLAEAESSLNPAAESPVGAKGLFQLMPDTAKRYGLSTFLPDERKDPDKSAHAAARDLRSLHRRFGSWPLAFAAYNAGEGRVQRLLATHHARTYADIAPYLPGETRMYVPKVCALITLRSGGFPSG